MLDFGSDDHCILFTFNVGNSGLLFLFWINPVLSDSSGKYISGYSFYVCFAGIQ